MAAFLTLSLAEGIKKLPEHNFLSQEGGWWHGLERLKRQEALSTSWEVSLSRELASGSHGGFPTPIRLTGDVQVKEQGR
jgi:hypothetical protein